MAEKDLSSKNSSNHIDKEWNTLWAELDSIKKPKGFHEQTGSLAQVKNFKKGDFGIGASMIGQYADPIEGFKRDMRAGAGHIEFSPSIGGGSRVNFNTIGKERRAALRDLARINKTTIHTHAEAGITGMSGFDQRNYSFSEQARKQGMDEIKKAIDFAYDIEQGGPITFHSGEFMRPLAGQSFGEEFKMYDTEKDDSIFLLVDTQSGEMIREAGIRSKTKIYSPVIYSDKEIEIEELGQKIKIQSGEPVEYNNIREFAADMYEKDKEFKKKADSIERNAVKNINGKKEITNYEILELANKNRYVNERKVTLAKEFNNNKYSIERTNAENLEVKNIKDYAEKILEKEKVVYVPNTERFSQFNALTEEEFEKKKLENPGLERFYKKYNSKEELNSHEITTTYQGNIKLKEVESRIAQNEAIKNNIISTFKNEFQKLNDTEEGNRIDTISHYALQKSRESYTDLAMQAYEKTLALKKRNPKANDIHLAIENLFPDKYGSHPQELLRIIKDARENMTKRLLDEHKVSNEKDARKIADSTIKATFDTGHLNMWKKYFRYKENESPEERDKKFQKWAIEQTKGLVEAGVIGNIHMADNFGYEDDHLAVGQGNVPIKEYMELFDRAKGEGKITGKIAVEGGFDEKQNGVHEAWKQTGVQVFRSMTATDAWTNPGGSTGGTSGSYGYGTMINSYVGNYNKPAFIFGKYSPDQNEWGPWSETSLE